VGFHRDNTASMVETGDNTASIVETGDNTASMVETIERHIKPQRKVHKDILAGTVYP
jgi:hypothetical protein